MEKSEYIGAFWKMLDGMCLRDAFKGEYLSSGYYSGMSVKEYLDRESPCDYIRRAFEWDDVGLWASVEVVWHRIVDGIKAAWSDEFVRNMESFDIMLADMLKDKEDGAWEDVKDDLMCMLDKCSDMIRLSR